MFFMFNFEGYFHIMFAYKIICVECDFKNYFMQKMRTFENYKSK